MSSNVENTHQQAIRATDFIHSIGVNTHIDFYWSPYSNTQFVIDAINYIGVDNLRDCANSYLDAGADGLWQQVASATGAKFDAYVVGTISNMRYDLTLIQQLAEDNLVNYIEGGNESDSYFGSASGNDLQQTALFQQELYTLGRELGLPVINMSFGQGWGTSVTGNYGTVGDLSAYTDFANAHTYFGTGNTPGYTIDVLNGYAQLAASQRPVIATEMGWHTNVTDGDTGKVSESVQAKYMLDGLLDAYKAGDVKTYLYELVDQGTDKNNAENNFGLFRADGSAKPAADALHNLTSLLADTGAAPASFTAGALSYSLTGAQSTDQTMLMQKSDGSYWLAIWNESRLSSATTATDIVVPNHDITLSLSGNTGSITVYDPLTGTSALQALSNAGSAQISLPDHPVLVKIADVKPVSPPVTHYAYQDLSVTAPGSANVALGASQAIAGVVISDDWAQHHAGYMALNVSSTRGTISMTDAGGHAVAGSGTNGIHVSGTFDQLNAMLQTLNYDAPDTTGGTDSVRVNVWNQAGVNVTRYVSITNPSPYDYHDLSLNNPSGVVMDAGGAIQLAGISINDEWARHHVGQMALNLNVSKGTISMRDANGNEVAGSGTHSIHVSGTYDQLTKELASLGYHAPDAAGSDKLSVNVWNQAGVNVTNTVAINASDLSGDDSIQGASGKDILSGGGGADIFRFAPGETGIGEAADHILDFNGAQGDKINLHGFGLSADNFAGGGPLGGSLSFGYDNTRVDADGKPYTLICIDANGDHIADHEIRLDNTHMTLDIGEFTFG
jgi:hypothetical protein